MRGIPQKFGTEQDVINAMKIDSAATKEKLRELLDGRMAWFEVGVITDDGVTDATHKVIEAPEDDKPDAPMVKTQYELREDENATMFKIGLTVAKINSYLSQ